MNIVILISILKNAIEKENYYAKILA